MKIDMDSDEYVDWLHYKRAKRDSPEGKKMITKKVTAEIKDPAVISKIMFLHEKAIAARYGAEELFSAAKKYQEDIWLAIEAELPEHFDEEERDENGEFTLSKGKTYNHKFNQLHYVVGEYVDEEPADTDVADTGGTGVGDATNTDSSTTLHIGEEENKGSE